jgi:hypothetical protein
MIISSYPEARDMFDKIVKSGKVNYKDIINYDENERKLFEGWESNNERDKKDYPSLSDKSVVTIVVFGQGDVEFERKEF